MGFAKVMGWYRGLVLARPTISIPNPGWETGDTTGWTVVSGNEGSAYLDGFIGVKAISPRTGTYALWVYRPGGTGIKPYAYYDVPNYAQLLGLQVEFSVWAIASAQSGAGPPTIELNDGVGTSLTYLTLSGTYVENSVTRTIEATATQLRITIRGGSFGSFVGNQARVDDMRALVL